MPGYGRYWPCDELAPFVEHFWTVEWDLEDAEVHEVLPHPSVHLVIERGASRVVGIPGGRFTAHLEGKGRVLGTKFRPGGFRPFFGRPLAELTGRTLPLEKVLVCDASALEDEALACSDAAEAFRGIEAFLCGLSPARDDRAELAGQIVARAAADQEVTRVEHLVESLGIGQRSLQRLFADYVGVSPKWVIQRYRLHEAAERIAAGAFRDWADLALDLGYADQAHFIRDFRRWVGCPPAEYARELAEAT